MKSAQIEAETMLRRTERAVYGDVPGETVLLDVDAGIALRLNSTGAWIWEQLEQPQPVALLSRGLDEGRAIDDVVAFAREMTRRELMAAS